MTITPAIANLAMSVVTGAIKLGKRLDEIAAEQTALTTVLSVELPPVLLDPDVFQMKAALELLLAKTSLAEQDRKDIANAVKNIGEDSFDELLDYCTRFGALDQSHDELFAPDDACQQALRKRSAAWDLDDAAIRQYTFYVAAGDSRRRTSVGFQIGAAILDVVAEVAATNTGLVVEHEPTRKLVVNILTRFSEPDLSKMAGWGEVLKHVLRVTLNTVIDERDALVGGRVWVERTLSAIAYAREQAPNGDDFVVGLLNGNGVNQLLGVMLTEGAEYLSEGQEDVWESILSDVLLTAADKAKKSADFESFFHDNWHTLVGAGLHSLGEHGTRLLDDNLLKATLVATVKSLAGSFQSGPPTGETLTAAVEAAISVFSDADVLPPSMRQKWLGEMIASVATVIRDEGLRNTFSQPALERYARGALQVLSRHPDIIASDSEFANTVIDNLLRKLTTIETFEVGQLADITVGSALEAIADNPRLIAQGYASVVGDLAHDLAERVANGGIRSLQANAILESAIKIVATNEFVFLEAQKGLSAALVNAVADVAASDDGARLLAGNAAVTVAERLLQLFAQKGLSLPAVTSQLGDRMRELMTAGLGEARELLGKSLAQSDVPELLVTLTEQLVSGKKLPAAGTAEFEEVIAAIAIEVAARAA